MRTRYVLVQPLHFDVEEPCADQCAAAPPTAPKASAESIVATFLSLIEKAQAYEPAVVNEIVAILSQFTAGRTGGYGANGTILAALTSLLQKAVASLPTLLPEIAQLIALFGGTLPVAS